MILRKILATSFTRILNAIVSLVILWIATNNLGPDAWGVCGLVLLDVSLILLVVELVSGSAIVYHSPRENFTTLFLLAILWNFIVTGFFALLFFGLSFFPDFFQLLVPKGYAVHILLLVLLNGFMGFSQNVLLGKEKISSFNLLFTLQFSLMLSCMATMVFVFKIHDARAYILSLYLSYALPAMIGFYMIKGFFESYNKKGISLVIRKLFHFGILTQLSSIAHLINKRLSFFVLKQYLGLAPVGIYNSGAQLTEGLRLIGQSISLVQFSSLSNSDSKEYARKLSIQLLKFSVILTTLALLVLIAIPEQWYSFIFGREFGDIRLVIISLSPGVIFLAANTIFTHYFSGTGIPKYNLYASLIGLIITIPAVFFFISRWQLAGAGWSASAAYGAAVIYQWFVFKRLTGTYFIEILPNRQDLVYFRQLIRKLI
jgi:O-antigen/teichoic acid export membrane protein